LILDVHVNLITHALKTMTNQLEDVNRRKRRRVF